MITKVMFNSPTYGGRETDGVIPVTVVATRVTSFPYTVKIIPSIVNLGNSHPAQPDIDFVNDTKFLTFKPERDTSLQKVVNITILMDSGKKGHAIETFKVSLFLFDSECSGVEEDYPSEAIITFTDA